MSGHEPPNEPAQREKTESIPPENHPYFWRIARGRSYRRLPASGGQIPCRLVYPVACESRLAIAVRARAIINRVSREFVFASRGISRIRESGRRTCASAARHARIRRLDGDEKTLSIKSTRSVRLNENILYPRAMYVLVEMKNDVSEKRRISRKISPYESINLICSLPVKVADSDYVFEENTFEIRNGATRSFNVANH